MNIKTANAADFWEPRRALTLDAARRHSSFIRLIRAVLLICAAVLFGILVWYFISAPKSTLPTASLDETVKMINPVYKGRTKDGLPYRITAEDAVRFLDAPDAVSLSAPILNFLRVADAKESTVHALVGIYNSKEQSLSLDHDVRLNTDDGYLCDTAHSLILVKDKRIMGDKPIQCDGSFGTVTGQAYEINDHYSKFIFKNNMTARLIPDQTNEALRGVSSPASQKSKTKRSIAFGTDLPVDVKAKRAIYTADKIVLHQSVDVRQKDARIRSDRMDLYREVLPKLPVIAPEKDEGEVAEALVVDVKPGPVYGNINKIIAKGNFIYSSPESTVAGDQGVYIRDENTLTVTGNVVYTQKGGDKIDTCRLIYDLARETAKFDGSCGNAEDAKNTKPGENSGRVVITVGGKSGN